MSHITSNLHISYYITSHYILTHTHYHIHTYILTCSAWRGWWDAFKRFQGADLRCQQIHAWVSAMYHLLRYHAPRSPWGTYLTLSYAMLSSVTFSYVILCYALLRVCVCLCFFPLMYLCFYVSIQTLVCILLLINILVCNMFIHYVI